MKLAISDPGNFAFKNAVRAAIVVPAAFAISLEVLGLAEMALFAGFGSIALLVFVDFGGSLRQRLCAYLVLVGSGAVLVALALEEPSCLQNRSKRTFFGPVGAPVRTHPASRKPLRARRPP